ncbi:hypothetical protein FB451DRAFT_1050752, partial [Mycena latifolia]
PPEPKIFHGRESEVSLIIQSFVQETPRIAILGAGGLGKTSLARAVLHHPKITARYDQHRVFIACDTASSSLQLAAAIGAHIGLKAGRDLTQPVIVHFRRAPPSMLILDNLETVWEPRETREDLEIFLSSLADIDHLTLIITMRGAERPARVRWTRPFLQPLVPLTLDAARKTFIDIADDGYSSDDIDKILVLADNMPLAIDLLAHLVDYEGLPSVLDRWETESTSLVSDGHDKDSNLDLSISLSLASPRIASHPHALDLLSLLSLLPDGLADIDLIQSQLPLVNPLACKAALLRTSLAYVDPRGQLKVLAPIREYVRTRHPPMAPIVQPILKHFFKLLEIYDTYVGTTPGPAIVARIKSNFANLHNILLDGLDPTNCDLVNTIYCICQFDRFSRLTGHGQSQLIHRVPDVLPGPRDFRLEVYFLTQLFQGQIYCSIPNADFLVNQALECFPNFEDPDIKCGFYALH